MRTSGWGDTRNSHSESLSDLGRDKPKKRGYVKKGRSKPGISYGCSKGFHSSCSKATCTCTCGHPTNLGGRIR